jgi:sugar-specific transcriptional regulator TrmB
MTIDEIKKEAETIQSYLDIVVSKDPKEMAERISNLMSYMSRSGEMLARAKKELRARKTTEISKTIISIAKAQFLSATVQNALLDSICEEESFLVDWIERINRGCVHQIDGLRSLLSYEKEEMRLTKTGY